MVCRMTADEWPVLVSHLIEAFIIVKWNICGVANVSMQAVKQAMAEKAACLVKSNKAALPRQMLQLIISLAFS